MLGPAQRKKLENQVAALIAKEAGSRADDEAARIIEAVLARRPEDGRSLALEWALQRASGSPLGLVLGNQSFMCIDLLTKGDVLAPRDETELLGMEVLTVLQTLSLEDPGRELRMIDMGCGSGNLSCALAVAIPRMRVWASDLTAACAELTRLNVAHHSLGERVRVSQGDLFAPLSNQGLEGTMDLVVMNPPYIPSKSLETSHAGLLQHEPREAFDGGPYGISILTRLLQDAPPFLKAGGHLLFEFGLGQARIIRSLVDRSPLYSDFRFVSDAQGELRVGILTMKPAASQALRSSRGTGQIRPLEGIRPGAQPI